MIWSWLLHVLGVEPRAPSTAYNFWSGFGSDLGELALLGTVLGVVRHHSCHVKRCWRLGKHPHGPYRLCSKHHPLVPDRVTEEAIKGAG